MKEKIKDVLGNIFNVMSAVVPSCVSYNTHAGEPVTGEDRTRALGRVMTFAAVASLLKFMFVLATTLSVLSAVFSTLMVIIMTFVIAMLLTCYVPQKYQEYLPESGVFSFKMPFGIDIPGVGSTYKSNNMIFIIMIAICVLTF